MFCPRDGQDVANAFLRERCLWGGSDKQETIAGVEMLGYEFISLHFATLILNEIEDRRKCDLIAQTAAEILNECDVDPIDFRSDN